MNLQKILTLAMSLGREKPVKNSEDWKISGESAVLNTEREERCLGFF